MKCYFSRNGPFWSWNKGGNKKWSFEIFDILKFGQFKEAVILMFVKDSDYLWAYQPVGKSHFVTERFQEYSIALEAS